MKKTEPAQFIDDFRRTATDYAVRPSINTAQFIASRSHRMISIYDCLANEANEYYAELRKMCVINAQLEAKLAASPDLLAALETMYDYVSPGRVCNLEMNTVLDIARAAIAKAKGEGND